MILVLFSVTTGYCQKSESNLSQSDSKYQLGIQLSYISDPELYFNDGASFSTSANVQIKNHLIQLGPIWWFDRNESSSALRGFIFSYEFFPFKKHRILNFYFLYDLVYSHEKRYWETSMSIDPPNPQNEPYSVNVTTKWEALANQIGYGFRLNIYKGLYLDQNFSIGIEVHRYKSENEVVEAPELSYDYRSSGHGTNAFLKLGLGYSFK